METLYWQNDTNISRNKQTNKGRFQKDIRKNAQPKGE